MSTRSKAIHLGGNDLPAGWMEGGCEEEIAREAQGWHLSCLHQSPGPSTNDLDT